MLDEPRLLGVAGWPVGHSRSPAMQGAALRELGIPWRYLRLPLPPELFAEAVLALPAAGYVGLNVTVPHKEAALALADSASSSARAIGAANTLTFADGAIAADNTDAPGLLAALGETPQTALVLGAGGAARAAVWALREAGAEVAVWNRTPERARELADLLGVEAVPRPRAAELLVNATAVGLAAESADHAIEALALQDEHAPALLADLVYGEGETALAGWGRARGARVVDGLEVLARQGALSLERWTGRPAPLEVMLRAARSP